LVRGGVLKEDAGGLEHQLLDNLVVACFVGRWWRVARFEFGLWSKEAINDQRHAVAGA
jgi:hypothetical protein